MSRLATSFVLGYHGCEQDVADLAIQGKIDLLQSDRDYDWLGPGAYFWESDPKRALEWALSRGYKHPAVVGAVIDLRNCLDLMTREDLELLSDAHFLYLKERSEASLPMPQNRAVPSRANDDRLLRFLDCAVIRFLHGIMAERKREPFDTVRGMFIEGGEIYPGNGFRSHSHIQIAVRSRACILGIFKPIPYPTV